MPQRCRDAREGQQAGVRERRRRILIALGGSEAYLFRAMMKVISWNLLRLTGASLDDIVRLIRREHPDILLMQEATPAMDGLTRHVGGHYLRSPLPGRLHGLATWSRLALPSIPIVLPLPSGAMFHRVCQVLDLGAFSIANVHLSHGQILNRRQLRCIVEVMRPRAAVLGDYNLVGPALLPGFRDVGPREHTHIAAGVVPLRIDRCLVRGLACTEARALLPEASDHRPIAVRLDVAAHPARPHWARRQYRAIVGERSSSAASGPA